MPARPNPRISLSFFVLALTLGAALASCGGPDYPKCETDAHCEDKGEVCVDGTCQQCRDDEQCQEGEQCNGGRCEVKPECTSDGDCTDNKVCRSGKCQLECSGNSDCGSGLKCENNRCVDECSDDSSCPTGMTCQSGRCAKPQNVSRSICLDPPAVRFAFNMADISSEAESTLTELAECFKAEGGTVTIEGHCDERGTVEYNLALGDRRARAVKKYLSRLGVSSKKMRIVSKGELEPAEEGSNESAWAANRRAEFKR